jgi:hypothetical protein
MLYKIAICNFFNINKNNEILYTYKIIEKIRQFKFYDIWPGLI